MDERLSWSNAMSFLEMLSSSDGSEIDTMLSLRYACSNWQANTEATTPENGIKQQNEMLQIIENKRAELEKLEFPAKTERLGLLDTFEKKVLSTPNTEEGVKQTSVKLVWRGKKKALYDVFQQLKNTYSKDGAPMLDNTIDQIANFIIQNFEGYENTSFSTVRGELSKQHGDFRGKVHLNLNDEDKPV